MSTVAQRAAQTRAMVAARRAMGLSKKPRKRLPPQVWPSAIARAYAQRISAMIDVRQAYEPLLRELPALLASARGERMDAGESDRLRKLAKEAAARLADQTNEGALDALAREFAAKTSTHERVQLNKQVHAALGADIFASEPNLAGTFDNFAAENVALVRKISASVAAEIETMVTRAVANGQLSKDLSAQLQKAFNFPKQRAQLIATDQIGKLYGQLNAARQQAIGVTRFIWRTASDSRVRPEHVARNGKEYSYDNPPDGELPGTPIRCRCYAEPIFDDLLAPGDKAPLPSVPAPLPSVPAPAPKPPEVLPSVQFPVPPKMTTYDTIAELQAKEVGALADAVTYRAERWEEEQALHVRQASERPSPDFPEASLTQKAFREQRERFNARLTPAELDASIFYSHGGDGLLNGHARDGTLGEDWAAGTRAQARILDSVIAKHPMPANTIVSRGVSGTWIRQFAESLQEGDVWLDPAYVSTSANSPLPGGVEMIITIPKGYPAAPIASQHPHEDEFLLPRNTKFRLVKRVVEAQPPLANGKPRPSRIVLHLEVVP